MFHITNLSLRGVWCLVGVVVSLGSLARLAQGLAESAQQSPCPSSALAPVPQLAVVVPVAVVAPDSAVVPVAVVALVSAALVAVVSAALVAVVGFDSAVDFVVALAFSSTFPWLSRGCSAYRRPSGCFARLRCMLRWLSRIALAQRRHCLSGGTW